MSPISYEQLLCAKIPKVQKDIDELTVFFKLLGSGLIKSGHKHVGEIDFRPSTKPLIFFSVQKITIAWDFKQIKR
jgi:hypothetical protein